jgi:hypothetical protein
MNTTSTKTHIFIGDIHGRDSWQKIVEQESQADIFIFYGDYFDSKGRSLSIPNLVAPKRYDAGK